MKEGKNCQSLFAANLIRLRTEAGLSQKRLAEVSGLTHNFINDLENMKKGVSFKTMDRLSEALGVEPLQLFIDLDYWNKKADVHYLAILDNLNKNINRTIDYYRRKA